jgi:hypothetical protein
MRYLHKTVLSKNGSPCTTFKEHEVKPQAVFSFTLERTLNSNSIIAQKGETKKKFLQKAEASYDTDFLASNLGFVFPKTKHLRLHFTGDYTYIEKAYAIHF